MDLMYRFTNQGIEYWYMSFTLPMSATQKKRSALWNATGRYSSRVSSIIFSVLAASSALTWISFEVILDCERVLISPSSSRMLPLDSLSNRRMVDSMFLSCAAILAFETTSSSLSACRSARSLATVIPSSWSSRPSCVIVKLSSVTLTLVSGA